MAMAENSTLDRRSLADPQRAWSYAVERHVWGQSRTWIDFDVMSALPPMLGLRGPEDEAAWREVPPALGRTLRRVGSGSRGIETGGEGRWSQEERVSPFP